MELKVSTLLTVIAYYCLIANISGQCIIDLPKDPLQKPKFFKKIGSHTAVEPNDKDYITLHEGNTLTAKCPTNFLQPGFMANERVYNLYCQQNRINNNYSPLYISCDSFQWKLYETAPFTWCPPQTISYLLARPIEREWDYLAGICYNFTTMRIVSLHYAVSPKFSKYLFPNRLRNYTPSVQVTDIPIQFTTRKYDNPQFKEWMKFANYQNHSIIQNPSIYMNSYSKFGGLVEFPWWSGLRLGNWRRYEEALSQFIESNAYEYEILAGISGTVAAPIYKETCRMNASLVDLVDEANVDLPLYVWHYLKSTTNDSDNLVVIGVNSPFYEYYNQTEVVFCPDICHTIHWLQRVHTAFHYKTMGRIFCCSVEEVKQSQRLYGFPPKVVPTLISLLLPQKTVDEFYESSQTENRAEDYVPSPVYNDDYNGTDHESSQTENRDEDYVPSPVYNDDYVDDYNGN